MSVLVTGGAGYIGSHTVRALERRGYEVIVVDNLSKGHRGSVNKSVFYEGDIRDKDFL
ncbi:MAG TPA: NAD-dependent epimerase/dehydratase family protein, partial [Natronincola sp.]|nr:NAD-dependent epimerase/dehydratase family protein [Natronincola sp.]